MVNPACICYLNSVMQQLFMIKPFRKAILNLDLNREILHKSPDKEYQFLYQLQVRFYGVQSPSRLYSLP